MTRHKIYLRRIYLDKQGYNAQGQYYGIGQPLFEYQIQDEYSSWTEIRAFDRIQAKEEVLTELKSKGYKDEELMFAR